MFIATTAMLYRSECVCVFRHVYRFYAKYKSLKPNTATMEKSQLKYNYLLQPDDVTATNQTLNGNVLRSTGSGNDVIIQRA